MISGKKSPFVPWIQLEFTRRHGTSLAKGVSSCLIANSSFVVFLCNDPAILWWCLRGSMRNRGKRRPHPVGSDFNENLGMSHHSPTVFSQSCFNTVESGQPEHPAPGHHHCKSGSLRNSRARGETGHPLGRIASRWHPHRRRGRPRCRRDSRWTAGE